MKIIYIKIKNYKSIRELEINDIENALILVGKNNTGKTSVIDALLLASDLKPAPAHEFLDITKPIDISIQIEFTEEDLNIIIQEEYYANQTALKNGLKNLKNVFRHIKTASYLLLSITTQMEQQDIMTDLTNIIPTLKK